MQHSGPWSASLWASVLGSSYSVALWWAGFDGSILGLRVALWWAAGEAPSHKANNRLQTQDCRSGIRGIQKQYKKSSTSARNVVEVEELKNQ